MVVKPLYVVRNGEVGAIDEQNVKRLADSASFAPEIVEKYRQGGRGRTPGEIFSALRSDVIFRMPANNVLESL